MHPKWSDVRKNSRPKAVTENKKRYEKQDVVYKFAAWLIKVYLRIMAKMVAMVAIQALHRAHSKFFTLWET